MGSERSPYVWLVKAWEACAGLSLCEIRVKILFVSDQSVVFAFETDYHPICSRPRVFLLDNDVPTVLHDFPLLVVDDVGTCKTTMEVKGHFCLFCQKESDDRHSRDLFFGL